jgi:uncharacterized membrane protein
MSTGQTNGQRWSDQKIEGAIGRLLQAGVLLSACIVFFGACVYLVRHGNSLADYRTFRGEPADYRTLKGVMASVLTFHGRGIIQLGLFLLIATPITRVAFSIWGFAAERDKMYVAFTVAVLAILIYCLVGPS